MQHAVASRSFKYLPLESLVQHPVPSFSVTLARAAALFAKQGWSEPGGTEAAGGVSCSGHSTV